MVRRSPMGFEVDLLQRAAFGANMHLAALLQRHGVASSLVGRVQEVLLPIRVHAAGLRGRCGRGASRSRVGRPSCGWRGVVVARRRARRRRSVRAPAALLGLPASLERGAGGGRAMGLPGRGHPGGTRAAARTVRGAPLVAGRGQRGAAAVLHRRRGVRRGDRGLPDRLRGDAMETDGPGLGAYRGTHGAHGGRVRVALVAARYARLRRSARLGVLLLRPLPPRELRRGARPRHALHPRRIPLLPAVLPQLHGRHGGLRRVLEPQPRRSAAAGVPPRGAGWS